ncbi:MAG: Ax21 family protein [Xanthomonadaceae bacterium]|jgi:Ax21 family sulfation-dependent quorum factor|nr:Ax21 family protein [Xanthomonadaceae bacterium]
MKKTIFALAIAAAIPFAANAEGLSYDSIQVGYMHTDNHDNDGDGWGLKSSAAITQNFHIFGGYNTQNYDHGHDIEQWNLGVGYNREIARSTDVISRIAFQRKETGNGYDFNGYSVEIGARTAFLANLEGFATVGWEDYRKKRGINPDSQFYGRLGMSYAFTKDWAIAADVKLAERGHREWFVGPQFAW